MIDGRVRAVVSVDARYRRDRWLEVMAWKELEPRS